MSYSDERRHRGTRRDAARDKARELREAHRKRERRNRVLLQGGIGVGFVVVVVVIFFLIQGGISAPAAGPLNMQSDGITIGQDFKAVRTPAIPTNGQPVATTRDKKSSVVTIRVYLDYFCPGCGEFERTNGDQISSWLKSGAATIEIHPLSLLDRSSLGLRYSSRAANAAACVANYDPDSFWPFTRAMYAKQPKEGTGGLTNAQIVARISGAGASDLTSITSCVNKEKFKSWVIDATSRAENNRLPDSNVAEVTQTPTVIVDGLSYTGSLTDASAFASFIEQAAGAAFKPETSGPTPTATPVPKPTSSK